MQLRLPRKAAMTAGAAVAALGLLGGGFALGNTTGGDESRNGEDDASSSLQDRDSATAEPREPADGQIGFGSFRGDATHDEAVAEDADVAIPRDGPGCPAPLGDVVSGDALDLASGGFNPRLLDGEFTLAGVSFHAVGECNDEGRSASGKRVMSTSWLHDESGLVVSVDQRESDEPVANARQQNSAQLWDEGYTFNVHVRGGYETLPVAEDAAVTEEAEAHEMTEGSGRLEPADAPQPDTLDFPARGGSADAAEIEAVLDSALSGLAPGIPAGCYFTEQRGGWDDLAALGFGDPREAIPSGFEGQHVDVRTITTPEADCPGADREGPGSEGFHASLRSDTGDGWIEMSAWQARGNGHDRPAAADEDSVTWTTGDWRFAVHGHQDGEGLGADTLQAIAVTLDPGFDVQCMVEEHELTSSELGEHGFKAPELPDGYSIAGEALTMAALPEDCDGEYADKLPAYQLSWSIEGPDHRFEILVTRDAGDSGDMNGHIGEHGMGWQDADGTVFRIRADSRDEAARDAMLAIAHSLDPSLDPTELDEGDGDVREPMPEPDTVDSDAVDESPDLPQ